jgi:hypothetical protein
MARAVYAICGLIIFVSACTERMICPAYQSAYIYDKNELRKKFSYFQEDSTPKLFTASKTKYLIAEPTPYRKKIRSLQTVPMKQVAVFVPDSISGVKADSAVAADLNKAALSVMDTTMVVDVPAKDTVASSEDSTYVITKDKEVRILKYNMPDSLEYDSINNKYVAQKGKYYVKEVGYNTEQDNYMWYLRRSLVLPDVKLAKLQAAKQEKAQKKKKKKGLFGFINKLLGKKDQHDVDSAELEIPKEEPEFDFIDTTAQVSPDQAEQRVKRERRTRNLEADSTETVVEEDADEQPGRKQRRKEEDQPDDVPVEDPKKEEGGDGF